MAVLCKQCGLCRTENDALYCCLLKERVDEGRETCGSFIRIQYDGGVRYTPEEHLFLLQNQIEARKMKKMEGLHFRG